MQKNADGALHQLQTFRIAANSFKPQACPSSLRCAQAGQTEHACSVLRQQFQESATQPAASEAPFNGQFFDPQSTALCPSLRKASKHRVLCEGINLPSHIAAPTNVLTKLPLGQPADFLQ